MIDWLFRDRGTGKITVVQAPNASFIVFLASAIARRLLDPAGHARTALQVVGTLALVWWAGDEIIRGVNPWRRLLGAGVLTATLVGLALS